MGMPMIIGAGIGALGSAAMGKSPFTGALLGGVTGGAFGGAGGFGSGFTESGLLSGSGLNSAASSVGGAAQGGINFANIGSNLVKDQTGNLINGINFANIPTNVAVDGGVGNAINYAATNNPLTYITPSVYDGSNLSSIGSVVNPTQTFSDKALKSLENAPSSAWDWAKSNPTSALGTINAASNMMKTTPMEIAPIQPIHRANFDPSSAIAAAPTIGLSKEELAKNKVGQLANLAKLTDEDKRKIGQFYTSLIG
ncbi:hypothetical protein EB001_09715 [bacterium]|nr:hypothetical protein [bacterium]